MTAHDALLVDLDGTVYAGPDAVPGRSRRSRSLGSGG